MRVRSQLRCSPSRSTTRPAAGGGRPKEITVVAKDASLYIAKDVPYAAWTFDGTVPGRALRVVEGDKISLHPGHRPNATHRPLAGLPFGQDPTRGELQDDPAGRGVSWSFAPKYPGAFMYHCGTPPVLMHIGTGMYGAMIVDPKEGWSAGPGAGSSSRASST